MSVDATIFFDGSCRPGPSGREMRGGWCAVLLTDPPLVASGATPARSRLPDSTRAEWLALEAALAWVSRFRGLSRLKVRGDSRSVVDVLRSAKRTGQSGPCHAALDALRAGGTAVDVGWVPRGLNVLCDGLARG